MEGESSWISQCTDLHDETDKKAASLDVILPDDLIERILAYLPIASIFRAGSVCKRWNAIVASRRYLWIQTDVSSRKPWYFMCIGSDKQLGYAYDPALGKWYNINLPCKDTSSWFLASSGGLVCLLDSNNCCQLYICNPITRSFRSLVKLSGPAIFSEYSAPAMSVNRATNHYNVAVLKSKHVPESFFEWEVSVHLYDSETGTWVRTLTEVLSGWRGGEVGVICDGKYYFLVFFNGGPRYGLVMCNLTSLSDSGNDNGDRGGVLMESFIPVPCSQTYASARLMNMRGKLVVVGGIGKEVIKGIGVWVLEGRSLQELARMPHELFRGLGELDFGFDSGGTDDLIYIQSHKGPAIVVFDVEQKQWGWLLQKCPVTTMYPSQLHRGFFLDPRLEMAP